MVCSLTCLNWAIRQGIAPRNPLHKRLTIPKIVSRGRDSVILPKDYEEMIAHANERLRDLTQPGIGHVVGVRQEDRGDAAVLFKTPHEPGLELRPVDQPVPLRVPDEVAVAAVGLRRVGPAVEDRPLDRQRE